MALYFVNQELLHKFVAILNLHSATNYKSGIVIHISKK